MDPAEGFEDELPRVVHELVGDGGEEEVVGQHALALPQLLLRPVEVEVDVQALDELRDRVLVHVALLLHHPRQLLHGLKDGLLYNLQFR